jgi:hypothetical protein
MTPSAVADLLAKKKNIYLAFVHAEMAQSAVLRIFLRRKKIFILRLFMRKWHNPQSRGYSCVEKKYLSRGCSCGNDINLSLAEILAMKKNCSISRSFMQI